jgi:hypothetical protein
MKLNLARASACDTTAGLRRFQRPSELVPAGVTFR